MFALEQNTYCFPHSDLPGVHCHNCSASRTLSGNTHTHTHARVHTRVQKNLQFFPNFNDWQKHASLWVSSVVVKSSFVYCPLIFKHKPVPKEKTIFCASSFFVYLFLSFYFLIKSILILLW